MGFVENILVLPTPSSDTEPATKGYVDGAQPFDVLEVYNAYLPKNVTGTQQLKLSNLTKVNLMKAAFMEFKFSNIPQSNSISLQKYSGSELPIYLSVVATGVGTSSAVLPFNRTYVESSTRIARITAFNDSSNYLVLMVNNIFYTFLNIGTAITSNITFKAYIYVPKY